MKPAITSSPPTNCKNPISPRNSSGRKAGSTSLKQQPEERKREAPILMSSPMVRAILEGLKCQTRRILKPQWPQPPWCCPFGRPGDRLWVREAFAVQPGIWSQHHDEQPLHYLADTPKEQIEDYVGKPSIHMPRWASRITLEITKVRVERVQDISAADCEAEGIKLPRCGCEFCARSAEMCPADAGSHIEAFRDLWNSVSMPDYRWEENPFVWVLEFERVKA